MTDPYSEQLSSYLDGELELPRRRRLEAHLAGCADCTALLADLRAIVAAAPHYQGRAPSRELWHDIAARLDEPAVLPLEPPRPAARAAGRRFSWPQLIAASLLMTALGGAASYLALRPRAPASLAVQPAGAPSDSVKTVAYAEEQYDAAVRDLERLLDAGRSRLDTATVRTIELSLRKIDVAIAEARAAIQRDSANAYLTRQIAANMRRKLNLLRVATNAIART